jgi:benzodiazapine receptor
MTRRSLQPQPRGHTKTSQALRLIGLLAATYTAAGIGSAATAASVTGWYQTLEKPSWNPPDWIFGPVWTALYCLMAIAAWAVWRRTAWPAARTPLAWFAVQLALNVGWSLLFFGLQSPGAAFAEILVLWLAIVATTLSFRSRSTWAALLMIPYVAWTTFAVVLNAALWRLNP